MKFHRYICVNCDLRWGEGNGEIDISMCWPCSMAFKKHVRAGGEKMHLRPEREVTYIVYKRAMSGSR